ncbi:MAG: hypothetical protein K2J80_10490, partial [Oscillospiraceae bacterium]|nr:hypothetical protein [Oscillospiraceae bacterium]
GTKNVQKDEFFQFYILNLFKLIFKVEYSYIFINHSENDFLELKGLSPLTNRILEDSYTSVSAGHYDSEEEYVPRPLDVYLSITITKILNLLICTNTDLSSLKSELESELSRIPGYDNSCGFIRVNNVLELIMSAHSTIEDEKFNERLTEYFPFMRWQFCESISVNSNGKLMLNFSNEYEKYGVVEFKDDSFSKLLHAHSRIKCIPIPAGYEDIAVNITAASHTSYDKLHFYMNYTTFLWDDFDSISKRYEPRLAAGENKKAIIDEIMPSSDADNKPILNLLRFIYHNRAYNKDLSFEDAWKKIYKTYRSFVSKVLDCI